jgi:hypothetical protein
MISRTGTRTMATERPARTFVSLCKKTLATNSDKQGCGLTLGLFSRTQNFIFLYTKTMCGACVLKMLSKVQKWSKSLYNWEKGKKKKEKRRLSKSKPHLGASVLQLHGYMFFKYEQHWPLGFVIMPPRLLSSLWMSQKQLGQKKLKPLHFSFSFFCGKKKKKRHWGLNANPSIFTKEGSPIGLGMLSGDFPNSNNEGMSPLCPNAANAILYPAGKKKKKKTAKE